MSDDETLAGASLRAAYAADYPALCAAAARCGPAVRDAVPDASIFALRASEGSALVAVHDEAIIGYLLASPLAYDGDAPLSLWVEAVIVVPDWRRRGLATALYVAFATAARALGTQALLTSPAADPALAALLTHVGFVTHRDGVLLWRLGEE